MAEMAKAFSFSKPLWMFMCYLFLRPPTFDDVPQLRSLNSLLLVLHN